MTILAEKTFIVEGNQKRTWDCLTKALLRAMPLEQIDFINEQSFSAKLIMKMGFITLPMKVNLEITELEEPEHMTSRIKAEGMNGLVQLEETTRFTLSKIGPEQTQIVGEMKADKMSFILWFLKGNVKKFARESLEQVEHLLKQWV
jgi:carbon monoxide dehydrogenase subunit G